MKTDLDHITQSSQWFDRSFFVPCYNEVATIRNPFLLQLAAPLIGMGDGIISSAQAACGLFEAVVKGSANIIHGAANRDARCLKKGALQISLGGGAIVLFSIPIITFRMIRITAQIISDPMGSVSILQKHERIATAKQ